MWNREPLNESRSTCMKWGNYDKLATLRQSIGTDHKNAYIGEEMSRRRPGFGGVEVGGWGLRRRSVH